MAAQFKERDQELDDEDAGTAAPKVGQVGGRGATGSPGSSREQACAPWRRGPHLSLFPDSRAGQ